MLQHGIAYNIPLELPVVARVTTARDFLRTYIVTGPDIWYVSYRSNITRKNGSDRQKCVRATRKFKTEGEAKQFANEMIKSGWSAIAGTLNPHQPKKAIASTQILDWISGDAKI
jgi:hypothetical protein